MIALKKETASRGEKEVGDTDQRLIQFERQNMRVSRENLSGLKREAEEKAAGNKVGEGKGSGIGDGTRRGMRSLHGRVPIEGIRCVVEQRHCDEWQGERKHSRTAEGKTIRKH